MTREESMEVFEGIDELERRSGGNDGTTDIS